MGGWGSQFLSTEWSLITDIQRGEDHGETLIARIMERYWKPVYCYIRRKGVDNETAKDLTQGFFQEVVLGRSLIRRADPARGSFRRFLMAALEHYLRSEHRRKAAVKRCPKGQRIALDQIDPAQLESLTRHLSAEESFNYAWLSSVLDEVLAEVETQCQACGLETHWRVFCDRVVAPILAQRDPPSLTEICAKHGVADCIKASNMVITVNRRLRTALRRHLRQYVSTDTQVDEELEELLQMFCNHCAG
jgi:RNA polymerase sigma-70 factor (ECF subfamily)